VPEALPVRDEPPGDGVEVAPVEGAFADVAGAVALAELAGDDARDGVTDGNRSARRAAARGKPAEVRPAMLPTGVYPLVARRSKGTPLLRRPFATLST